jgi:threonine dehydrogenase-like Zn-dependent dehydrogenase
MLVYRGQVPATHPVEPASVEGTYDFPIKYGYANVGRVVAAGSNAPYKEGDLVFVRFPHQDLYTVRSELAFRLPEYNDPAIGVFCALLDVSVNLMLDVPIRLGEVVAVFGQGVVGTFAAQLARRTAGKLIAVDPYPLRRQLAVKFGADAAIPPETALDAIMEASDGRGADVAIEASGAPEALQAAINATAFEGTIAVPAWYGTKSLSLTLGPKFHLGRQRIVSSQVNVVGSGLQPRWTLARRMQVVADVLPTLHPTAMITHRISFEQAPVGYQLIDQHPEQVLSLVFDYGAGRG